MKPAPAGSLLPYLSQVLDPRGRQGRRHCLEAMLASVVCAMLQGARSYTAITQWIHDQDVELWHALGFTRRPPKLGAFRKLLMTLPPQHFEQVLADWAKYCLGVSSEDLLEAVAMDGKTLCGTLQPHERAVHLLALLDQRTGCVLSQSRVDAKTNEHKGALELLKTLVLKGRVITGDAMFCQRDLCQQIRDDDGHYFFVVKDNQPTLNESIAAEFKAAPCYRKLAPDKRTTTGVAYGRSGNGR